MTTTNTSHCKLVKAWLESGRAIDQRQAREMWRCERLASRIDELRHKAQYGYMPIRTINRGAKYSDNTYALYVLDTNIQKND